MSIGDALAEARGRAGLTIAQVSQRTCIRETIIRGIERGDFSACGGDFYARGHVRSIARAVGLDPEELVHEYDAAHGTPHPISAADVFQPATPIKLKERRGPNWTVALVIVLLLVVGYGVYRLVSSSGSPHQAAAGLSHRHHGGRNHHAAQAAGGASTAQATHSHRVVIRLTALQACWVGFSRPDGTYISMMTVSPGTTRTWRFRHAIVMQIGNPGGILLTVNGKDYGRPGSVGQPLTFSFGPGRKLPTTGSPG